MKHTVKIILFAGLALIALFGMTACPNNAGGSGDTGGGISLPKEAVLTLSPDKLTIEVTAKTADGSAVTVVGCRDDEKTLASGTKTTLHAQGTTVTLKGDIIELECDNNKLTALDVRGLTALQTLLCYYNDFTELNVQGLTALQILRSYSNRKLTALDVQGCTVLKTLMCYDSKITTLDVQGLIALETLWCGTNQLTTLNVQGLTALQSLSCSHNNLKTLNVRGLTALQTLECHINRKLKTLDVQGCPNLKNLQCYDNWLDDDVLTALLTDLPERRNADGAQCVLYTVRNGTGDHNHTNFTAPPELKNAFDYAKNNKQWKMLKQTDWNTTSEI